MDGIHKFILGIFSVVQLFSPAHFIYPSHFSLCICDMLSRSFVRWRSVVVFYLHCSSNNIVWNLNSTFIPHLPRKLVTS